MMRLRRRNETIADEAIQLELFISYASVDNSSSHFVNYVHDMLQSAGHNVWMDRNDIQLSEEWWARIKEGINNADRVIVFVSDNWLASKVCNMELHHALQRNPDDKVVEPVLINYRRLPNLSPENLQEIKTRRGDTWNDEPAADPQIVDDNWRYINATNYYRYFDGLDRPKELDSSKVNDLLTYVEGELLRHFGQTTSDKPTLAWTETELKHIAAKLHEQHNNDVGDLTLAELERLVTSVYETLLTLPEGISRAVEQTPQDHRQFRQLRHELSLGSLLPAERVEIAEEWLHVDKAKLQPLNEREPGLREFIEKSRRAVTRRRRRLIIVLSVLLVIATIAAIIAGIQSVVATNEANRANAEANARFEQTQTLSVINSTVKVEIPVNSLIHDGADLFGITWDEVTNETWLSRFRSDTGQLYGDPVSTAPRALKPVVHAGALWSLSSISSILYRHPIDNLASPFVNEDVGYMPGQIVTAGPYVYIRSADTITQIDAASGRTAAQVNIDGTTRQIVFDDISKALWLVTDLGQVYRSTSSLEFRPVADFSGDGYTRSLLVINGSAWVNTQTQLWSIQPDGATTSYSIGREIQHVQYDDGYLWLRVASASAVGAYDLLQFDTLTGQIYREIPVGLPIYLTAISDGRLWVVAGENHLLGYDLSDRTNDTSPLEATLSKANSVSYFVFTPDALWLFSTVEDLIERINLRSGHKLSSLTNCPRPASPIFDGATIWVACQGEGQLAGFPASMRYYGIRDDVLPPTRSDTFYTSGTLIPPHSVYDDRLLWVPQHLTNEVLAIPVFSTDFSDPEVRLERSYDVGTRPLPPLRDGEYVWLSAIDNPTVRRVRIDNPVLSLVADAPPLISVMRIIGDALWIGGVNGINSTDADDLYIINRTNGQTKLSSDLGVAVTGIVQDGDRVWISALTLTNGLLLQFDLDGQQITLTEVDFVPGPALLSDDAIWLSGMYPGGFTDVIRGIGEAPPDGSLLRLDRDGTAVNFVRPVDNLRPSTGLLIGEWLWFTSGDMPPILVEGYDTTEVQLAAYNTVTDELVTWLLCDGTGITPPVYSGGGYIWVGCQSEEQRDLMAFDKDRGTFSHAFCNIGSLPWPPVATGDYIWFAMSNTNNVAVLRASTGELIGVYGVGRNPGPPVSDGTGNLWIANTEDGTVQRLVMPPADAQAIEIFDCLQDDPIQPITHSQSS